MIPNNPMNSENVANQSNHLSDPKFEWGSACVRKAASPERGAYRCATKQPSAFDFTWPNANRLRWSSCEDGLESVITLGRICVSKWSRKKLNSSLRNHLIGASWSKQSNERQQNHRAVFGKRGPQLGCGWLAGNRYMFSECFKGHGFWLPRRDGVARQCRALGPCKVGVLDLRISCLDWSLQKSISVLEKYRDNLCDKLMHTRAKSFIVG